MTNNHVEICDLINTFTNLMNNYLADREINLYAEHNAQNKSVKKIYHGALKNLNFGSVVTALAMVGYTDINSVRCRVTTFNSDDMVVITIL